MQMTLCQKGGWVTQNLKQIKGLVSIHIAMALENV